MKYIDMINLMTVGLNYQIFQQLGEEDTLMESQLEIKLIWALVLRLTVVFQMIGGSIIWIMIHGISYQIFQEMEGITG